MAIFNHLLTFSVYACIARLITLDMILFVTLYYLYILVKAKTFWTYFNEPI